MTRPENLQIDHRSSKKTDLVTLYYVSSRSGWTHAALGNRIKQGNLKGPTIAVGKRLYYTLPEAKALIEILKNAKSRRKSKDLIKACLLVAGFINGESAERLKQIAEMPSDLINISPDLRMWIKDFFIRQVKNMERENAWWHVVLPEK